MIYFIPKKGARLGNWLFQYAVAASIGDGRVATLDVPYARLAKVRYSDFLGCLELVSEFPDSAPIARWRIRGYRWFFSLPLIEYYAQPIASRIYADHYIW